MLTILFSMIGTVLFLIGSYIGLSMSGIIPPPTEYFGGWLFGLLPVVLGALSMLFFGRAYRRQRPYDE